MQIRTQIDNKCSWHYSIKNRRMEKSMCVYNPSISTLISYFAALLNEYYIISHHPLLLLEMFTTRRDSASSQIIPSSPKGLKSFGSRFPRRFFLVIIIFPEGKTFRSFDADIGSFFSGPPFLLFRGERERF